MGLAVALPAILPLPAPLALPALPASPETPFHHERTDLENFRLLLAQFWQNIQKIYVASVSTRQEYLQG